MKINLLILASAFATSLTAQVNWQTYPGAPTGFWDMDTLNGKLYVSSGLVQEYDGTSWTTLSNYNNSLNTPNKTKSCVKNINGKLYAGAKDFNTSGEGTIHYLSASTWSAQQTSDFPYHGNNKIRSFALLNNVVYTSGLFTVPGGSYNNIAKWNGNDWVNLGKNLGSYPTTTEIVDMESHQNKLYLTEGNGVWVYDGNQWDSIINSANGGTIFPLGSAINDLTSFNGDLYMSGYFALSPTNYGILLMKYSGNSFTALAKTRATGESVLSSGTYTAIGKMGVVGNKLYFVAKKTSDNHVYLVSYNGSTFTEVSKLANYGESTFSPGSEMYYFRKIIGYKNDLVIGGTFSKVNGQNISGLAHLPSIVSLKENSTETFFSIYPNPSNGTIKISHDQNQKSFLTIRDALGRCVFEQTLEHAEHIINLQLPAGIYLAEFKTGMSKLKTQKLIIQ